MTSCANICGHIHRSTLVVVAHSVKELLWRYCCIWLNPERHLVVRVHAKCVVDILVHTLCHRAEEAPYTRLTATHTAKVKRSIGVTEAELLVAATEVTSLAGE